MRISRFLLLWWILVALAAPLCNAQDKTLLVRPLSDAPAIVKRALIIAVSDYENANHLPETINDARLFADLLRTRFGFPDDAITLMTDAPGTPDRLRPTYTHLVSTIDAVLSGVDAKSEIVVFFSGHGTRFADHDYLIPVDGAPGSVKATCIDYDDFKSRLKTRTPARALLIVDACRDLSGKGNESGIGGNRADLGPQIAELVSCQPKEVSQIGKLEDFHESVFTHFLLEGLKGDPEAVNEQGLVTFDSLKLFVKTKVSRYVANKYMDSQNPDGNTTLGSMVLARGATPDNPLSTEARLSITSDPPGATVTIDDEVKGKTPLTVTLDLGLLSKKTLQVGVGGLDTFKAQLFPVEVLRGKTTFRSVALVPTKTTRPISILHAAPHVPPVLFYEGFNYPANTALAGQNGGDGDFADAWTEYGTPSSGTLIASHTLSYGNLLTSGNCMEITSSSPVGDARHFKTPVPATGTLYVSFLTQPLNASGYYTFSYGELYIGKGGSDRWCIFGRGHEAQSEVQVKANRTVFLVACITFHNGHDTVELYVNPTPGRPLPARPDAMIPDFEVGSPNDCHFGGSSHCYFDEIRIARTYEAVSPVK